MHRSRLAGFIVDCRTDDVQPSARFWSEALGMATGAAEGDRYVLLDARARDLHIEVQRVEQLHQGSWVVMEAPTGQRFCVVRAKHDLAGAAGVTTWK